MYEGIIIRATKVYASKEKLYEQRRHVRATKAHSGKDGIIERMEYAGKMSICTYWLAPLCQLSKFMDTVEDMVLIELHGYAGLSGPLCPPLYIPS